MNNLNNLPGMDLVSETLRGSFYVDTVSDPNPGFYIMEEWKDIEGYEDLYQISSYGRVLSLSRDWHEEVGKSNKDKILKSRERRHGYYAAALYKDKKRSNVSVHRLVAQAFVLNPNDYNEVNHKDGDKQNNNADNLEWCTHSHNLKHAFTEGHCISQKGSQMHNSKLTENIVIHLRGVYSKGGIGIRPLARMYGVSKTTMSQALKGVTWKHI